MNVKLIRRGLTGLVGLFLISSGLAYAAAWIWAGRLLDEQRQEVAGRLAEFRSLKITRPVFFEPAESGNSWELLQVALPFWSGSHTDPDRKLFYTLTAKPPPDPRELERVWVALKPRVDDLKAALRRTGVEPLYDYINSFETPHVLQASGAFSVLNGAAKYLQDQGRLSEAVDCLLICFSLADRMRVKHSASIAFHMSLAGDNQSFDTLRRLYADHRLGLEDGARLASAIDALDASWPAPEAYYRDQSLQVRHGTLVISENDIRPDYAREHFPWPKPQWKDFYSRRIQTVRMLAEESEDQIWIRDMLKTPVEGWYEAAERRNAELETREGFWSSAWYLKEWGKIRMRYELARTATAVSRFAAVEGRLPATLEQLVPKYLARVPTDPYANLPLGYWVDSQAATIVSQTRDPKSRNRAVGRELGPDADGYPSWSVRKP
jgi:hypothetical protein